MPIIRIELLEGRPPDLKEELIRSVTQAVTVTLGVQPAQVRVLLYELPPGHWGVGGQSKASKGS
jgi:4-oxalocrotonate tautomerase